MHETAVSSKPAHQRSSIQNDIYRIDTINYPDDGHMVARNM